MTKTNTKVTPCVFYLARIKLVPYADEENEEPTVPVDWRVVWIPQTETSFRPALSPSACILRASTDQKQEAIVFRQRCPHTSDFVFVPLLWHCP